MEKAYHYMWKHRLFSEPLRLVDGSPVSVIDVGKYNTDAGPDFFNAHVKIDDQHWAGNVEIHIKASDWYRHKHDADPVYDTVVLHVVGVNDARISRKNGETIPQMLMPMSPEYAVRYARLSEDMSAIRCKDNIGGISRLAVADWLETLAVERLQMKARKALEILDFSGGDWEQTCFVLFARSLGFGLNGDPFERLARSLPLRVPSHHSDNQLQLDALLFGQAGVLDPTVNIFDEYYQQVCREYIFLARKYGLRPMPASSWRYSRTRPQNFPHRRIAMLARKCFGGFRMFKEIMDNIDNIDELRNLFRDELSGYWATRSTFAAEGYGAIALSETSIDGLLINCVAPLCYAYASHIQDPELSEKVIELLMELSAEKNVIIRDWKASGIEAVDALQSQALIQLRKEYCDKRNCFSCRFGYQVLKCSGSRAQQHQLQNV